MVGFTPTWMAGLAAGLGAGLVPLGPTEAMAQSAEGAGAIDLPTVTVANEGEEDPNNTLNAPIGLSRLPGTVQDTPQTINVVTPEMLQQQNVTTLEQALRNVPSVTASIGEGNGGMNGDQFRIRGFNAQGDMFVDGLRDFGVYTRDSFNYEQVMVLKGTSGETFGVGTTGGAINIQSKRAFRGDLFNVEGTAGSGPLGRGTVDINRKIDDTTALRINAMLNEQDIVDRDSVKSDRWGVAASLGVGLGTDATLYVNYFFQHNNRTPDFGVPVVGLTLDSVRKPVTEYGVPRQTFYGKSVDTDQSDINMFTALFKKEFNDAFTFSNDARFSLFDRFISPTAVNCPQSCADTFFAGGNPILSWSGGGGVTYDQSSWAMQNVTTFNAKFETGSFRHEAIFGLDVSYQNDDRQGYSYYPSKLPMQTIWTPTLLGTFIRYPNPANIKSSWSQDVGLFVSDRMWFTEQWSIIGGLRWDFFKSHYDQISSTGHKLTDADTDFPSPKLSLMYEPTRWQTYYLSYSQSANLPFGQWVTSDVNPIVAGRENLDPETSETYEIGAKISLLEGRLGLSGALFQTTKQNAYYTDADGDLVSTGDEQRVRGLELGLSGNVTEAWVINIAYAYLDSEILDSAAITTIGNPVQGVPKNSGSLWTTYELSTIWRMPGKMLLGGGITYRDAVYIRNDMLAWVPYSFTLDALVSYEYENYRIALNGYNLTDRVNYDTFFQGSSATAARAIPSSGRTVVLTLGAKF